MAWCAALRPFEAYEVEDKDLQSNSHLISFLSDLDALHVGGGITDQNAIEWIDAGAEKVRESIVQLHYDDGASGN